MLAVVAAHYHGFGSGVYTVSSDEVPATPPQDTYFTLSGDGGGRDFDEKEVPKEARMVGSRIGGHLRVAAKPGSPWKVDMVKNASSFVRLYITYEGPQITDCRVPLRSVVEASRAGEPARRVVQSEEAIALRSARLAAGPR